MEVWKDIKGFENYYQVSDLGNVRSITRFIDNPLGGLKQLTGKPMNPYLNKKGYLLVTLRNQHRKVAKIHRLVAKAFIPNPENKPEVNHKNGVKTDNSKDNLEWSTNRENIDHSWSTGLNKNYGENHANSKFTESDILAIRLNENCLKQKELAKIYNTTQGVISKIQSRIRWKHI